jgi:hypothetical protein
MLDRIADGRTDLVFEYVSGGHLSTSKMKETVPDSTLRVLRRRIRNG